MYRGIYNIRSIKSNLLILNLKNKPMRIHGLNGNGVFYRMLATNTLKVDNKNEEDDVEKKKKSNKSSNDDMLGNLFGALGLVFIGSVIGWFYRNHKNSKNHKKFQNKLLDKCMLDNDEIIQIRLANKLNLNQFDELVKRVRIHYKNGFANPDDFFKFCANQLGDGFEYSGGKFKAEHLIERLIKSIKREPNSDVSNLDDLIIALTVILASEPKETLKHIFNAFAKIDENKEIQVKTISIERLSKIIDSFRSIFQIPVRVQTHEVHEYPFNSYTLADTSFMINEAKETVKKEREKEKIEKDIKSIEQNNIDQHDFLDLMLSKNICVWGECISYRIGSTIKEIQQQKS